MVIEKVKLIYFSCLRDHVIQRDQAFTFKVSPDALLDDLLYGKSWIDKIVVTDYGVK
jgi:hypothetical protein